MSRDNARIARVEGVDSARVQGLFAQAVDRWRDAGERVAGVIEETHGLAGRTCNAGVLRDVTSGERYSIFLEILPPGKACHIDATGAASAGAAVLSNIATCDLVVLSKFGKLEAGHAGLIGAFEAAVSLNKPLLTTVSEKHRAAWDAFAPQANVLPPSIDAILSWWRGLDQT